MKDKWYSRVYRRNVVDMHISDIDERFMRQFDAQRYVDLLVAGHVESAVVYAHSHAGLCFYPSQVGPMHSRLNGRDIVGEVVDLCHRNGICVVLYQSLIYDTWAYRHHSEWRIVGADGQGVADRSRYGVCCPNSPYREYSAALAREICEMFDVEGIRFDMTFWPAVCYCTYCRERFAAEAGGDLSAGGSSVDRLPAGDLPGAIDWQDARWVAFARRREAWLTEYAARQTAVARKARPGISVEHQSSTYPLHWRFGVTSALAEQNDFLQGDFYGDALQGSFVRKLFYNLSPNRPVGFETSIGVDLRDYTALKSESLLQTKARAALADGAAFVFIDSVDPVGTLNPVVYERMGRVYAEIKAYEAYLGGELCQDVGVYLSTTSKFDPADNGKAADDPRLSTSSPHVDAALSVCRSLREHHIPFGVITDRNLQDLSRHQIVVLPNVLMMDHREIVAFSRYVRAGGSLYASKYTSLVTVDGARQPDLLLADVLGVSYRGETREAFTYISPVEGQEPLFSPCTRRHPPGLRESQLLVDARPGSEVLGTLVLPYTDPSDPVRFASIHNNPPGIYTGHPAIVLNRFGEGRAMYVTGALESADPHREVFIRLIRLLSKPFSFEAEAPKVVEVTLFHQWERRRFLVNLVNFQAVLPNIPVHDTRVRVRLEERTPLRLLLLPEEQACSYEIRDGYLEFVAPRLETFAMFALDYA